VIGTLLAQHFGRLATGRDTEKTLTKQLDLRSAAPVELMTRPLAKPQVKAVLTGRSSGIA
jgi:hypothetical protein